MVVRDDPAAVTVSSTKAVFAVPRIPRKVGLGSAPDRWTGEEGPSIASGF